MSEPTSAGFIGLGLMGGPMAINLCQGGVNVHVWNRTAAKADPVVAAGATACATRAEVARECSQVFLCVFDTDAVEEVLFGADGIATELSAGSVIVDHSTISPVAAAAFARRLKEEFDIDFVDAPVTGGQVGAAGGTLTVFAGGTAAAVERVRPLVMHMASRFEHLGESGAGQAAKVCNQIMVQTTIAAMAEMVKLAEVNGIDTVRLLDLLKGGMAGSRVMEVMGERMASRSEELTGPLEVAVKDLDSIRDAGRKAGVALPLSAVSAELYRLAASKGLGRKDNSQVVRIYD